jgi:peptide/nickel transport system permease protein
MAACHSTPLSEHPNAAVTPFLLRDEGFLMRAVKIAERVLFTIPIMFGVAVIVFVFIRLTPGDPVDIMMGQEGVVTAGEVENLRSEFNLDKPLLVQLGYFLGDAVRGDLGYSYVRRKPVTTLILERLPATIELAAGSLFFALVVAVPIGIISAVRQNSLVDRLSMAVSFTGSSMPGFWLGIVLILVFSVRYKILPVQGRLSYDVDLHTVTGFYVVDSILTGNWPALKDSL